MQVMSMQCTHQKIRVANLATFKMASQISLLGMDNEDFGRSLIIVTLGQLF